MCQCRLKSSCESWFHDSIQLWLSTQYHDASHSQFSILLHTAAFSYKLFDYYWWDHRQWLHAQIYFHISDVLSCSENITDCVYINFVLKYLKMQVHLTDRASGETNTSAAESLSVCEFEHLIILHSTRQKWSISKVKHGGWKHTLSSNAHVSHSANSVQWSPESNEKNKLSIIKERIAMHRRIYFFSHP